MERTTIPPVRRMRRTVAMWAAVLLAGALAAACSEAPSPTTAGRPAKGDESVLQLTSPSFSDGAPLPPRHATGRAGGGNVSIPLEWEPGPPGTRSFAVAVVDPKARDWVHWLVTGIPPSVTSLAEGASRSAMPTGSIEHANTFGEMGWDGPQPPPGSGAHPYRTTVYALDVDTLDLPAQASFDRFLAAIRGHVLEEGSITGTFER